MGLVLFYFNKSSKRQPSAGVKVCSVCQPCVWYWVNWCQLCNCSLFPFEKAIENHR